MWTRKAATQKAAATIRLKKDFYRSIAMKRECTTQHASRPGFTLIELLLVVAIIVVLASLTIGGLRYYDEKTKFSRTEVLIKSIESALEEYKKDNGSYPASTGNSQVLFTALYGDGTNVYLDTLNPSFTGKKRNVSESPPYYIVDSWGNEIRYRHDAGVSNMANPPHDYDLWSKGPDGKGPPDSTSQADTADDIKNW